MNSLFKKKIIKLVDPMIGVTVIHFTTHGCQAQIHEFDYIGKIVDVTFPEHCDGKKFYVVEVLKDRHGEKRDKNLKSEHETVASWYPQKIGNDLYIAYD